MNKHLLFSQFLWVGFWKLLLGDCSMWSLSGGLVMMSNRTTDSESWTGATDQLPRWLPRWLASLVLTTGRGLNSRRFTDGSFHRMPNTSSYSSWCPPEQEREPCTGYTFYDLTSEVQYHHVHAFTALFIKSKLWSPACTQEEVRCYPLREVN